MSVDFVQRRATLELGTKCRVNTGGGCRLTFSVRRAAETTNHSSRAAGFGRATVSSSWPAGRSTPSQGSPSARSLLSFAPSTLSTLCRTFASRASALEIGDATLFRRSASRFSPTMIRKSGVDPPGGDAGLTIGRVPRNCAPRGGSTRLFRAMTLPDSAPHGRKSRMSPFTVRNLEIPTRDELPLCLPG